MRKPGDSYCFVHDLREVTEIITDFSGEVLNLTGTEAQIPPDVTHFTVLDLCGAFFSVPLSRKCQSLFAFTYNV